MSGDAVVLTAEDGMSVGAASALHRQDRHLGPPSSSAPPASSASSASSALPRPVDLQIRLNDDPELGFCIYALRPYRHGEVLYRERTALEATHDVYAAGGRNVYRHYKRLSDRRKRALHGSFPHLAWANGVDAREAAEARTLITTNLLSRTVVIDNQLTAVDHMRMRPDWADIVAAEGIDGQADTVGLAVPSGAPDARRPPRTSSETASSDAGSQPRPVPWTTSMLSSLLAPFRPKTATAAGTAHASATVSAADATDADKAAFASHETLRWFSRYAFRVAPEHAFPQTGKNHQAAVYLLTDLINHRCAGYQNCKVATDVGEVRLVAERDIRAGDEITINYSKDVKDFRCKGECCVRKQQLQQQQQQQQQK